MSDPNTPTPPADPNSPSSTPPGKQQPPPPAPAKKGRWLKRILIGVAVIVVLLIALVLLAPMLLSTGAARSFVVGKINDNLNGKVSIDDWSLSWTGGVSVEGVKLYDDANRLIFELGRLSTQLSLLDAAKGKIALGKTVIDEPNLVQLEIDENGKTNFDKLAKASPDKPGTPGKTESKPAEESLLPEISGDISINNLRGMIIAETKDAAGQKSKTQLEIRPSTVAVKIPTINDPIENDVKLVFKVGSNPEGSIALAGTVDAIDANKVLEPTKINATQKLQIATVDLAALAPFLKMAGQDLTTAGVANGTLDLTATGIAAVSANGQIDITNLAVGGAPLKGDTFKTSKLSIPVKVTRTADASGKTLLKIETLAVQMPQLTLTASGQVDQDALSRAAAGEAPGEEGQITVNLTVNDLPDILNQLPHLIPPAEGAKLTQGKVTNLAIVLLKQDSVSVSNALDITDVAGTQNGKPIKLAPINLEVGATSWPTGSWDSISVRDIVLALKSEFMKVNGGGPSVGKLAINGDFDFGKVRQEIGQFVDFGKIEMSGTGDFAINTAGDPSKPGEPIQASAKVNLNNVRVAGIEGQPPLDQPWLAFSAASEVVREGTTLQGLRNAVVTLQSGNKQDPTIDLAASADVDLKDGTTNVPRFELTKLTANLPKVQKEYAAFIPALAENKLDLAAGTIAAQAGGSFDGKTITLSKPLALDITGLTMNKSGSPVLTNETIKLALAGIVNVGDEAKGAKLSQLSLTTSSNLIKVQKAEGKEFVAEVAKSGAVSGNGAVTLAANLARVNAVAAAFAGPNEAANQLKSGQLDGTITFNRAADKPATDVTGDLSFTNLTVANYLNNETLKIGLKASAPDQFDSLVASVDVNSSFMTLSVANGQIVLKDAKGQDVPPMQMVKNADVKLNAPDLEKVYALVQLIAPQAKPETPATPDAAPPLPPLEITGGSANLAMNVASEGNTLKANLSQLQVSKLALKRGQGSFAMPRDVNLKLAATVISGSPVHTIQVNELSGDLGIAQISMPEPVVLKDLHLDTPAANGAVKLTGRLDDVGELLNTLQAKPPGSDFRGDFEVTQAVKTQGDAIALRGGVQVSKFQVMQGGNVQFSEDRIEIVNDLTADTKLKNATIKDLRVSMPSSGALNLVAGGGVNDWEKARQIQNVTLALDYDLEKLWTIIYPLMSAEQQASYKDLKIAGKHSQKFTVSGAYPDAPTYQESIKSVNVNGGVGVGRLDYSGMALADLSLPFKLVQGVVTTDAKTPQAKLNGGTLNLSNVRVDLTAPEPLLTISPNHKLAEGIQLNPVLSDVMGKYGNLLFADAESAAGIVDVTILSCNNVPLGEALTTKGALDAEVSVRDVKIASGVTKSLGSISALQKFVPELELLKQLTGTIDKAQFKLANGAVYSDLPLLVNWKEQQLPLRFIGGVNLADKRLIDFKAVLPESLIRDEKVRQYLAGGIALPFKGTTNSYQADPSGIAASLAKSAVQGGIGDLFNRDKDKDKDKDGEKKEGDAQPQKEEVIGAKTPEELEAARKEQEAAEQKRQEERVAKEQAEKEAEAKRREERLAREAEEKKKREEQTAKEAEQRKIRQAEQSAKEAEQKRIRQEKQAAEAEAKKQRQEQKQKEAEEKKKQQEEAATQPAEGEKKKKGR